LDNGARRFGYLLHPAVESGDVEDRPLVVWQQGGPTAPMTVEWGGQTEAPFNILPNFGISVLVVPLPGRDGFGPEFLDGLADETHFGQIDIDEQIEIVDQLVDAGIVSWNRVGVTGCSYGGYFTSQSITSYDDTYAAANTQCTLLDLFDEWEFGYTSYITYLMGRTPIDDWDEFYRDSPLQRGHLVQTPTLIFAGTEDFLPSAYSLDFHDSIVDAGTDADFYEFIGEAHGLQQLSSQFTACQAQIEWFRKYLEE
jgi:dipeptidyl aminopeptidase/acylaminoacyl peptidase